jgi:hypothetical protein
MAVRMEAATAMIAFFGPRRIGCRLKFASAKISPRESRSQLGMHQNRSTALPLSNTVRQFDDAADLAGRIKRHVPRELSSPQTSPH